MARSPRRKKASPSNEELLVGVDGGATEVKVHEILILEREHGLRLETGPASASMLYDRTQRFEPVPMAQQVLEEQRKQLQLSEAERNEGRFVLEAFVHAIRSVAEQAGRKRLRIGACLPGGKSLDGRGVVVMRNGPRLPDFLAQLEAGLVAAGLELAAPIPALLSDGEACAQGENLALEGLFSGVASAYYLGGGTGLAECCKIEGQIVDMDALRPWMRKAWQLEDEHGISYEDLASARGINQRYALRRGVAPEAGEDLYPEERIAIGDPDAETVLQAAATTLAQLFFSRIQSFAKAEKLPRTGRSTRLAPGAWKLKPGTRLERIVIGQQLGRLVSDPALLRSLREPLEEQLAQLLAATEDAFLTQHYLVGKAIRPGLIQASLLRAAPAIGAAAKSLVPARLQPPGAPTQAPEPEPPPRKVEESHG